MLRVVTAHVCSTDVDAAQFVDDIEAVDDASSIPFDELSAELSRLKKGLARLQATMSAPLPATAPESVRHLCAGRTGDVTSFALSAQVHFVLWGSLKTTPLTIRSWLL